TRGPARRVGEIEGNRMRIAFAIMRLCVAAVIVAAVAGQLATSLAYWRDVAGIADPTTQVVNFFSFFTIESNLLAVVALVIGAVVLLAGRGPDPRWFTVLRLCAATYMVTTGVVY